jgi:hypothetical protein
VKSSMRSVQLFAAAHRVDLGRAAGELAVLGVAAPAVLFWVLEHGFALPRHEAEVLATALGGAGFTAFLIRRF